MKRTCTNRLTLTRAELLATISKCVFGADEPTVIPDRAELKMQPDANGETPIVILVWEQD